MKRCLQGAIAVRAMAMFLCAIFSGKSFAQSADTIVNWASAANGGAVSVSSTAKQAAPAGTLNDGDRIGIAGSWQPNGNGKSSEWAQVSFANPETINTVTLFSTQDKASKAAEPTESSTFASSGAQAFDVQVKTGNNWTTVASVAGNNLVKRTVSFTPITTSAVRIVNIGGGKSGPGIVEIEAWGAAGIDNVAVVSAQALATASSSYGPMYPAEAVNDGVTSSVDWGVAPDGGWANDGNDPFPNFVDIAFPALRIINSVTLWTLQDDHATASPPDDSTQFSKDGLTAFDVQVMHNGWTTVASVTGNNLVKRTVTFPPVTTGYVRIVNRAGLNGHARIVEAQAWGVAAAGVPLLTGMEPRTGQAGSSVTLYGEHFSAVPTADMVLFNGTAAKISAASSTMLTVTVPSGATTGPVSVSTNGLTVVSAVNFTVSNGARLAVTTADPTITNFSPASGPAGTVVTITGTGFSSTLANNTVTFGTAPAVRAQITAATTTSLTVVAPAGGVSGVIAVTVAGATNPAQSAGNYSYPPVISGFTPTSGTVGTSVTVSGANFGASQGASSIRLNGKVISPVTSWSNTAIVVTIPVNAKSGPFTVTAVGSGTSSGSFTVMANPPTITGISPSSGPVGTTVTITGTNFSTTLGDNIALFNGTTATVTVATATTLTTTVPSGATTGPVSVNIAGQIATGPTFTVPVPPTITSFSPTQGSVGGVITIQGTNFSTAAGGNIVTFNGVTAVVTPGTTTTLTAVVPSGAATGPIGIQVNGLSGQSASNFTVVLLPQTITFGAAPTVKVGAWATLSATGGGSGQPIVFASTTPGTCYVTGNQIQGVSAGTCIVSANQAGNSSYAAAPQVTQTITVAQGTQTICFGAAPTVSVGGSGTVQVTGGASGNPVVLTSGTPGICSIIGSTTVNGLAAGSCTIAANQAGNANYQPATQATQTFQIYQQPAITSISPTQGPPSTVITINGQNFSANTAGNVVTVNGRQATVLTANPTVLTAKIPIDATTGAVVVRVGSLSANGGVFTVTPAPVVSGFTPFGGNVGDTVTISGSNFSSVAANNVVRFNGTTATVTGATTTSITALVPTGATTGPITVTVSGQTGTSAQNFFVLRGSDFPSTVACGSTLPPISPGTNPGQPGFWVNPNRSGTSWTFHFNTIVGQSGGSQRGLAAYWYTYDGSGRPVFLSNFGNATTSPTNPNQYLIPLYRGSIDTQTGAKAPIYVGQAWVVFVPGTSTNAAVRWQWNEYSYGTTALGPSYGADECVYNFFNAVQGNVPKAGLAMTSSTNLDASYTGLWTAPTGTLTNWSLDVAVATCPNNPAFICNPAQTYEFNGVFLFDTAGAGAWLIAQNLAIPPLMASTSIPLIYSRSNYAHGFPDVDCTSGCVTRYSTYSAAPYYNDNGALTRTYTDSTHMTSTLTASVPGSITGAAAISWPYPGWVGTTPMGKSLTENPLVTVSETYCATTCTITVSWMTGNTNAQLYKRDLTTNTLALFSSSYSGSLTDPLAANSDVQYELRDGSASGTLLYQSAEVKVGNPVQAAPIISSFTPASGPAGTTVTINGSNFDPTPGNNTVKFNNSSNATVQSATASTLTVVVPADATTGVITVAANNLTGSSSTPFTVAANVPTITGFTPDNGLASIQVTITGRNLATTANGNQVKFTGTSAVALETAAPSTQPDGTVQFAVQVPAGVQTGPISLTVGAVTVTSTQVFQLSTVPTFTPASGPVGTVLTLAGANFNPNIASNVVTIGGVQGYVEAATTNSLTVTVLSGTPTGQIQVIANGITASGTFSVTDQPATPVCQPLQ